MSSLADLFAKYNCTNCQDEISGVRVHCAECENFDLCLQCFACGAEIGDHKKNHDYQFMDTGSSILSVYRGRGAWTAREEGRLLDALEHYGFGNWEDISKHIETRSAEDAKEEYVNKFVNGTIGRHTWIPAQSQRPTLVDHTEDEDPGPLGASAVQRLPPLDITPEEAAQLGYMPNRDGFEREYDPTAEQLISNIALNADDTEADYMLKLAHVDMYTRRLRERNRRKRLVRDYQLVANFFRNRNYVQQPGMTKEQKDFRDRFRVYAQFYTSNEYERLLGSLEREKELRIRLAELYRYRHNGLTKIDECRHFEQHAAMAQHRSTGPFGHGKTDNTHLSTGSLRQPGSFLHSPQYSSKKANELSSAKSDASSSLTVPNTMHPIGDPTCSGALSHNKNYLDSCRGSSAPTMTPTGLMMMTTSTPMPTTVVGAITKQSTGSGQAHPLQTQPPPLHVIKNLPQVQINNVVIDEKQQAASQGCENNNKEIKAQIAGTKDQVLPPPVPPPMSSILRAQLDELKNLSQPLGSNMLTSTEQQLCKNLRITPSTYFSLKTMLLAGGGAALSPNALSPQENMVRKYFLQVGWLSH